MKQYKCLCCGDKHPTEADMLCPPCKAANCAPWYRPEACMQFINFVHEHGDPIGVTFACGSFGCESAYHFKPKPRLQVVKEKLR